MTPAIDLRPDHRKIVQDILREHLPPGVKVWVFGSRAEWTTKDSSDLDLALEGDGPLETRTLMEIELAFEESLLPFQVDVVDLASAGEAFREVVLRTRAVLAGCSDRATTHSDRYSMRLGDAFIVNPSVKLQRGEEYPFVAMSDLSPGCREAVPSERRRFRGGGSRFRAGDTLMARITPCLENGKIARFLASANGADVAHGSTEFIVIRGRPQKTDSEFGYYLTLWDVVRDYAIAQMSGTSGRQRVPTEALKSLTISIPRIREQREIARVLGALDDRIELNRRMNETLEAMARALYKSWFVDFDPVRAKMEERDPGLPSEIADLFPDRLVDSELGQIPEGWERTVLQTIAALNPESWSTTDPPEVIRYVDLKNTKWGVIGDITSYMWRDAPGRARRILRQGDTIVGTVRPGNGSYALVDEDGLTGSTGFAVLRPLSPHERELLWCAVTSTENVHRLALLADGGAYPAVGGDAVAQTPVVLAGTRVRRAFSAIAGPLLKETGANRRITTALKKLRDTLLPRLVSGEVRLPKTLVSEVVQ